MQLSEGVDLNDVETFVRVVEAGTFTAAAAALGVPKSTISRRVARLEEALGVSLLARKARSFTVSPTGQRLHARCAPALREIAAVASGLHDADAAPRGLLRITAPHDLGSTRLFAELFIRFRAAYPGVIPCVELSMRSVDLIEEGFDVAFRPHIGQLPDSDVLMVRSLDRLAVGLYASPGYLERRGRPRTPSQLRSHECLTHVTARRPEVWALRRRGDEELTEFAIGTALVANDFSLLIAAALADGGIGVVPMVLAEPHVLRGELCPVLPRWTGLEGQLSLLWPATRQLAPRVRAFIEFATRDITSCPGRK